VNGYDFFAGNNSTARTQWIYRRSGFSSRICNIQTINFLKRGSENFQELLDLVKIVFPDEAAKIYSPLSQLFDWRINQHFRNS